MLYLQYEAYKYAPKLALYMYTLYIPMMLASAGLTIVVQWRGCSPQSCGEPGGLPKIIIKFTSALKNSTNVKQNFEQNGSILICLKFNGTDEDFYQNSTSTDDLDLKETLDDLNCNNSYNIYIVWVSADRIECCLREQEI